MKKLIAISVMCALVVGAAFAETSVGGAFQVGGKFLNGDNVEGSHIGATDINYDNYNSKIFIQGGNPDAGAKLSVHFTGGSNAATPYDWYGWWKPIPQLRVQIGVNADGDYGTAQITGWGFTSETKNAGGMGAIGEYSGPIFGLAHARKGFYDGTGERPNIAFNIFPIEGLTINLWIPIDQGGAAPYTYTEIEANIVYRITDIGNVSLSFQGDTGYIKPAENEGDAWYGTTGETNPSESPMFFLSFYLTAIENMGVDLGFAYKLPFENKATQTTTTHPAEIGIGYKFNMGDFEFKLRSAITAGGKTVTKVTGASDVVVKDPMQVSININPNYRIKNVTAYFYAGIGIQATEDWEKETGGIFANNGSNTVVSWFINPYALIRAGDSVRFLTGFQIYSSGQKYPYYQNGTLQYDSAKIDWAIPFGLYLYF